ncbi:MAG: hypothetical protein ACYCXD_07055, partial [Coriobacteriia bacterium]
ALAGAPATTRETGALDAETLEFRNPFSEGVFQLGLLGGDGHGEAEAGESEHGHEGETLAVSRFATVVYTLGPIGWLLEALVTAAVLGYVGRVRPGLLFGGQGIQSRVARIGDEHGAR